jgi:hypothetical protein
MEDENSPISRRLAGAGLCIFCSTNLCNESAVVLGAADVLGAAVVIGAADEAA